MWKVWGTHQKEELFLTICGSKKLTSIYSKRRSPPQRTSRYGLPNGEVKHSSLMVDQMLGGGGGVAILLDRHLDLPLTSSWSDDNGRLLILQFSSEKDNITIANILCPNTKWTKRTTREQLHDQVWRGPGWSGDTRSFPGRRPEYTAFTWHAIFRERVCFQRGILQIAHLLSYVRLLLNGCMASEKLEKQQRYVP